MRVIKPRIGGGFGAKQTSVTEVYPALVTLKTKKPAKLVYSRYESQICSSPRHEMEVRVRLGADEHGILKAMDIHTLSNTGAYGEHGPTTVGLSGHKPLGLYGKKEAYRFTYEVCIPTACLPALTEVMGLPRESLQLSLQWMSWPMRWAWIR